MTYAFKSASRSASGSHHVLKFEGAPPLRTTKSYSYLVVRVGQTTKYVPATTTQDEQFVPVVKAHVVLGTARPERAMAAYLRSGQGTVVFEMSSAGTYRPIRGAA